MEGFLQEKKIKTTLHWSVESGVNSQLILLQEKIQVTMEGVDLRHSPD